MKNKSSHARHPVVQILAVAALIISTIPFSASSRQAVAQTDSPTWSNTSSLNAARAGHTATLRTNGKIAFVDWRYDGHERSGISIMNPDGSGRAELTATQILCPQPNRPPGGCGPDQLDNSPTWSPDGKQIAFIRSAPAPGFGYADDVYVMNADGSNQRRITQSGLVSSFGSLAWSQIGRASCRERV